jgi:hypothetical protein
MITDLLLVAGGALGGALVTWNFIRWENQADRDESIARHPSSTPPDDLPDWLNS